MTMMNTNMLTEDYALVAIENPLLDMSAVVKPEMLTKYGLAPNDAVLAGPTHAGLYKELESEYSVEYIAGGAAQNTMRGAQWLLPPRSTAYVGAVGDDAAAGVLRKAAAAAGLRTAYAVEATLPTGRCGVLLTGTSRALVTDLQAAAAFRLEHLDKEDAWQLLAGARVVYVGGYFLTVCPPAAMRIAAHAAASQVERLIALNLSAPFIPQFFKAPLDDLLPYADVVFGNEAEAEALAVASNFGTTDLAEIALKVAALPKINASRPRLVVFTHGASPTVVAWQGTARSFPVIPIDKSKIVDTNGAGDAFVGGFLSQFVQGFSIERCIAAGNYVANIVIQRSGPTYPSEPHSFTFNE